MGTDHFHKVTQTLQNNKCTVWIGQSVDTSRIHSLYSDFSAIPILTSVGCVMRRPRPIAAKFDTDLRERLGAKGRLMVDSGGFVLMAGGDRRWNIQRVSQLYRRVDADHLVSLDIPPTASDPPQTRRSKYDRTIRNLKALAEEFGERVVPVVHGTTTSEIEQNCRRITSFCHSPAVVGLGGLVPTIQRSGCTKTYREDGPHKRLVQSVSCVRSHFPNSVIHAFGVGSLHTILAMLAIGVRSLDSIGWRQAAGFGSVYVPGRHRRLLTNRARERPCRPFVDSDDEAILASCSCPECRKSSDREKCLRLAAHFIPRAAHNIWVLYCEVAEYFIAKSCGNGLAFLASRLSPAWMQAIENSGC